MQKDQDRFHVNYDLGSLSDGLTVFYLRLFDKQGFENDFVWYIDINNPLQTITLFLPGIGDYTFDYLDIEMDGKLDILSDPLGVYSVVLMTANYFYIKSMNSQAFVEYQITRITPSAKSIAFGSTILDTEPNSLNNWLCGYEIQFLDIADLYG
ncbi:MAG: hypothetical protein ACTSPO_16110, partial [Candidatus Heimdallarchaeaceae archaeon]